MHMLTIHSITKPYTYLLSIYILPFSRAPFDVRLGWSGPRLSYLIHIWIFHLVIIKIMDAKASAQLKSLQKVNRGLWNAIQSKCKGKYPDDKKIYTICVQAGFATLGLGLGPKTEKK